MHWALLIDNLPDFEKFLKDKAIDLSVAYNDAKRAVERRGDVSHVGMLAYCVSYELEKHKNRKTVFDDILIYNQTFLKPHIDIFNRDGKILVWQNRNKWLENQKYAGFMPCPLEDHPIKMEIIKTIEKDELIFPTEEDFTQYTENDISINKWQGGNHFYAKVGNFDVSIDNIVKWNTHDNAMENAKIFMNELNNGE